MKVSIAKLNFGKFCDHVMHSKICVQYRLNTVFLLFYYWLIWYEVTVQAQLPYSENAHEGVSDPVSTQHKQLKITNRNVNLLWSVINWPYHAYSLFLKSKNIKFKNFTRM